jgi:glycosyltransferase involved in cell wall biosynthesis
MKILMLAPEPFLAPRGTPLSIYFRINALSELGHKVDLVTYHLGEEVQLKNVNIYRIPRLFFIRRVKIGASQAKILLDLLLLLKTIILLSKEKYDLIYSHEEAALIGVALTKIWRLPHVYDMHSSLPQQMKNSMHLGSGVLTKIFSWIEHLILKRSQAVVAICPELLERVRKKGFRSKAILLENFLGFEPLHISKEQTRRIKDRLAPCREKIVLYTGNFQTCQGLALLLKAAAKTENMNVSFILVGGAKKEIEKMRKKAESLHLSAKVHFEGEVPPSEIPLFLSAADALISPRLQGSATPLKIYSYLRSGKPLVATNLPVHTQILDERISILVSPEAESLAEGLTFALFHPQAEHRARAARQWIESNYPRYLYLEKMNQILKRATSKSGKRSKLN